MHSQNQRCYPVTLSAHSADSATSEARVAQQINMPQRQPQSQGAIDRPALESPVTASPPLVSQSLPGQSLSDQPLSDQPQDCSFTDCPAVVEDADAAQILKCLQTGSLWVVNSRRRNGLILCKSFYAEFAGPGAAVGGVFDLDCQAVIPVGNLSMVQPTSHGERHDAYLIRRQWIRLTQQFTDQSVPLQRAQMILNQFENYFDQETIARIPDEAFALLVGVLPYSVRMARRRPGKLNVKAKT